MPARETALMCNEYEFDDDGNLIALYRIDERRYQKYPREQSVKIASVNPIVRLNRRGERVAELCKWGLVPSWWSKDNKGPPLTWNAVSEKIDSAPMFKNAYARGQRCLVPATAFFEHPLNSVGLQVRTRITLRDQPVFAFAGLWDRWRAPGAEEALRSYTILTTLPNDFIRHMHNRMPCILAADDYDQWLDPATSPDTLKAMMMPCPSDWLEAAPGAAPIKPGADKLKRWKKNMQP
jgi:putative SOS response-associated peptidase YedK